MREISNERPYPSAGLANNTVSHPERFLTFLGNILNKRGPLKGRDEDLIGKRRDTAIE